MLEEYLYNHLAGSHLCIGSQVGDSKATAAKLPNYDIAVSERISNQAQRVRRCSSYPC